MFILQHQNIMDESLIHPFRREKLNLNAKSKYQVNFSIILSIQNQHLGLL